ncbi:hypothetical protein [Streptomyces sp. NPDC006999]|uniref:hypothetical protein n=1 Tax=Streptomyces sp. NPDC006999 TaxID=3156909 RepID=UPI0033C4E707
MTEAASPARGPHLGEGSGAEAEAAEAAERRAASGERRAEITDMTHRVVAGALLTLPVLFAVMAHELFGTDWVPG